MTRNDGYKEEAIKRRKCRNKYWELEVSAEVIFGTGKGLPKKKHGIHSIWLIVLFLKMSGKYLKSCTFYLLQTKIMIRFSQKYVLLVLKTPRNLVRVVLELLIERVDLNYVTGQTVHVEYTRQLKTLQHLTRQSQKKLLILLKALWIVIPAMWYIFLNEKKSVWIPLCR